MVHGGNPAPLPAYEAPMTTLTRVLPLVWLLAVPAIFQAGCASPDSSRDVMSDATAVRRSPPDFYLGGIQVHEADLDGWFDALEKQSMNAVQVTEYARQSDWGTDDLDWDEPAARVLEEIRGAERRGLAVVYVCRVELERTERNRFLWHGMIMPESDQLIASWFEKYGRFVAGRAALAEREGVDVFMIGSELNALATTLPVERPPELEEYFLNAEKQAARRRQLLAQDAAGNRDLAAREGFDSIESYLDTRIARERQWARAATGGDAYALEVINAKRERLEGHWRALIHQVRGAYSGLVGYAANFDSYHLAGFWPSLDVMGINAYFKLRDRLLADESERHLYPLLVDGWRGVLGRIDGFRQGQGLGRQPVIFTEMGYTFRARSTVHPWADEGFALIPGPAGEEEVVVWRDQPERFEERAWAVRALWQAHSELERPFLSGILYWKLSSHDYHFGHESFLVHVGEGARDPILPELRRFVER